MSWYEFSFKHWGLSSWFFPSLFRRWFLLPSSFVLLLFGFFLHSFAVVTYDIRTREELLPVLYAGVS